jgi:hypothetical protein
MWRDLDVWAVLHVLLFTGTPAHLFFPLPKACKCQVNTGRRGVALAQRKGTPSLSLPSRLYTKQMGTRAREDVRRRRSDP